MSKFAIQTRATVELDVKSEKLVRLPGRKCEFGADFGSGVPARLLTSKSSLVSFVSKQRRCFYFGLCFCFPSSLTNARRSKRKMRKRSMSVFVARENNRLSKKFEGGKLLSDIIIIYVYELFDFQGIFIHLLVLFHISITSFILSSSSCLR